jgi:hypothetical protein
MRIAPYPSTARQSTGFDYQPGRTKFLQKRVATLVRQQRLLEVSNRGFIFFVVIYPTGIDFGFADGLQQGASGRS